MFRSFWSWIAVNTVDDILSVFSKMVVKLESLSSVLHVEADRLHEKANAVKTQAQTIRDEAVRAAQAASKIKDLIK